MTAGVMYKASSYCCLLIKYSMLLVQNPSTNILKSLPVFEYVDSREGSKCKVLSFTLHMNRDSHAYKYLSCDSLATDVKFLSFRTFIYSIKHQ